MVLCLPPLLLKLMATSFAVPRHRHTSQTLPDGQTLKAGFTRKRTGGPDHRRARPYCAVVLPPLRTAQMRAVERYRPDCRAHCLWRQLSCLSSRPLAAHVDWVCALRDRALYVSRYMHGGWWLTTGERIAEALA
ncbi:hypothetical protein BDV10DRAFT_71685 [Aspergillus recurvatus]